MLRAPAQRPSARIGSLVVNPGGPGVPGTDYAAQSGSALREPLLARYDIVGFDPRGTGASAPVDCLSDRQLDDYISSDPDPDTAAERREYAQLRGRVRGGLRGALRRAGLARHRPSRRPATSTSCAPRSGSPR